LSTTSKKWARRFVLLFDIFPFFVEFPVRRTDATNEHERGAITSSNHNHEPCVVGDSPNQLSNGDETTFADDDSHMSGELRREQRQRDERDFVTHFGPVPDGHHLFVLHKHELDSACKDTKHQKFAANFRVSPYPVFVDRSFFGSLLLVPVQ